jgi:pimeloyl-ACP methyl ester carboxylesterase
MPTREPFVRESGSGPSVVCLHSNASSSAQWRSLAEALSKTHRVLAPDLYGSGKSPEWPSDRTISLGDEVDLIEPVLARAGTSIALVGHSYGAAVALLAALRNPGRVGALVLYEPTLFALEESQVPSPNGVDGIRNAVAAASAALDAADPESAARHFIDFWMGSGSWAKTPPERKPGIAKSVVNVRRWAHALFTEPTPVAEFAALDMPVLYLTGGKSPESAHAVARRLAPALSQARFLELRDLGHMGPVTHPEAVNEAIIAFLGAA